MTSYCNCGPSRIFYAISMPKQIILLKTLAMVLFLVIIHIMLMPLLFFNQKIIELFKFLGPTVLSSFSIFQVLPTVIVAVPKTISIGGFGWIQIWKAPRLKPFLFCLIDLKCKYFIILLELGELKGSVPFLKPNLEYIPSSVTVPFSNSGKKMMS